MQTIPTYFDTVSADALTHIVHQIKEPTPTLLLSTPLVSVSESLFHTVILDNNCPFRLNVGLASIEFGERDGEDDGLSMNSFDFVLRRTGRFIKKVEIVAFDYGEDDDREKGSTYAPFIAPLLEHCDRVDKLEFMGRVDAVDVTPFLTCYRAQLSVLELPAEIYAMTILPYVCINDLCLYHENVDLKSIITAPLSSLEKLEISLSRTEEDVKLIARFTMRLKSLSVEFRTMDDASIFEIVASTNGATLEEVGMRLNHDAGGQGEVVKWIGELVDRFLTRCERLRKLWVTLTSKAPDINTLGTLLLPLKRRGVRYNLIFNDLHFSSGGWVRRQ